MLICASFSRNNICKKLSFPRTPFGNLLLNEKQKEPFVLLNNEVIEVWHLLLVVWTDTSLMIHIIMLISYCCFVRASEQDAERARFEFVLSWHRSDTRSVDFFPVYFSTSFKTKHLFKRNSAVEAAKSNRKVQVMEKSTFEGFTPKDTAWKTEYFCLHYFSKMKHKSTKTITEHAFSCQNKSVCQELARSCKKWKLAQKVIYALKVIPLK